LDGGQVLNESDSLLVSIVGGPDVMMSEIHKLMEPLHRHCENAHIIFGAAIDEAFASRLSVTLIASCRRREEATPPLTAAPPEKIESMQFLDTTDTDRPASRFTAPPPELSEEKRAQIMRVQGVRSRKKLSRLQKELPLEIVFKGRFEKSEPTIRHGEDLDVPTYIRRGVPLN
jgi:cell division protein FtsZ